jgi:rRNA maturation endonuclease Nob1
MVVNCVEKLWEELDACLPSVRYIILKKGLREVIVDTDDFQISAIETHLSLGFETFCLETSHKRRWKTVFEKINMVR